MSFSHLHLHGHLGSLLDGIGTSEDYCKKAVEYNHPAIAITDHGRLNGIFDHQKKCQEYGIKSLIGVEMYLVDELEEIEIKKGKEKRIRTKNSHIILLVKNKIGYENLLYLNYLSMKDSSHFYYNPRILQQELFEHHEGLVVGTACLANPFVSLYRHGKFREAIELYDKYCNVFGNDFYTEIQINEMTNSIDELKEGQKSANEFMMKLANKFGIPIVITGDVHYAEKGQDKLQTLSIAIRDRTTIDNLSFELESKELYYHDIVDYVSFNERWEYGYKKEDIFSWCNNTADIVKKCDFLIPLRTKLHIPKTSNNDDSKLILKAKEGLEKKFEKIPIKYKKRLERELEVIIRKGFSSYCLILEDIYKFVEEKKIYKGPARGCYASDAMVWTTKGYKKILNIEIGDEVINESGRIDEVINKFEYLINENLYKIDYMYGSNKFGNRLCTREHKQLVEKSGNIFWEKTENIDNSYKMCIPRLKPLDEKIGVVDLNEYNIFGFDCDKNFIYERMMTNKAYKFSIREMNKKYGFARNCIRNYLYTEKSKQSSIEKIEKITKMTKKQYVEYIKKNLFIVRKIKRFIKVDEIFSEFVGLLVGDGWFGKGNRRNVALAINSSTKKDEHNRKIFEKIYNRLFSVKDYFYENKSKTKKLSQLCINSFVFREFVEKEILLYDNNKKKYIKRKWLNQSRSMIKALFEGLINSDGHRRTEYISEKTNFDNTSLSLISSFCEISMRLDYVPSISVRKPFIRDGYLCKTSYKVHLSEASKKRECNENYYFIPVNNVLKIKKKKKIKVYDLSIKNKNSFMINNYITHNSGAGSLVLYCLGITTIDPIKYNLLFERFLNQARSSDLIVDYFGK